MIELKNGELRITQRGRLYLLKRTFYKNKERKKEKWDGEWRVLIFDIPENLRFIRDQIRTTLVAIGFMRLQDSVWIYPYNCEDLVILLKADLEIGKDLLYMIVDSLEDDGEIKNYFGLK
jgi:DNA-binding transcriptional regulator PaaX